MKWLKALALYSGGKDSHYALLRAIESGIDVRALIIVISRREDSWMFHTINIKWTKLHAEAMGLPFEYIYVSGEKEVEVIELLEKIKSLARKYNVDAIVTGVVASMYQKKRIDYIAKEIGVKHIAPLWGEDPEKVLRNEVARLEFVITAVQSHGLGPEWLCSRITKDNIERFLRLCRKHKINPVGEGGEFETFIINSPLMKKKIVILEGEKKWFPAGFGYYIIKKAKLVEKA